MEEQQHSNRSVSRSITATLACACLVMCCCYVVVVVSFATNYASAIKDSPKLKTIPAPGSIDLTPTAKPQFQAILTDSCRQELMATLSDLPLASQAVENGASDWQQAATSDQVTEVAAILRQGNLSDQQITALLRFLAEAPFQNSLENHVTAGLKAISDDFRRLETDLVTTVVKKWAARDGRLRQQLARIGAYTSNNRRTITFVTQRAPTQPETQSTISQPQLRPRPQRDFSSSVLAGFKIKSESHPRPQETTPESAKLKVADLPKFEDVVALLFDATTTRSTVKQLSQLDATDPIRLNISKLNVQALRQLAERLGGDGDEILRWYEPLAIAWRDERMLDILFDFSGMSAVTTARPEQLMRMARWAAASGDTKWNDRLLTRLPEREASLLLDAPARIFEPDGWEVAVAMALNFPDVSQLETVASSFDQPSLAGAIGRYLLTKQANWPDKLIDDLVQNATLDEVAVGFEWVELAHVNDSTRDRLTTAVSKLDEPQQKLAWKRLRSITYPCRVPTVAVEVLGQQHRSGTLWKELPALLSSHDDSVLEVIAKVLVMTQESDEIVDQVARLEVLRTIDAQLAARLLQGNVGTGNSFLVLADDFGGRATSGLLSIELLKSEEQGAAAKWSSDRINDTIDRIRTRLLLEGSL